MKSVGIREAKARLSHYVDLAREEGGVLLTERGRPVARLVGVPAVGRTSEEDVLAELSRIGLLELGTGRPTPSPPVRPSRAVSLGRLVRDLRR